MDAATGVIGGGIMDVVAAIGAAATVAIDAAVTGAVTIAAIGSKKNGWGLNSVLTGFSPVCLPVIQSN